MSSKKIEIEKLKATQATMISPQQPVTAITQAMSYMYLDAKKLSQRSETSTKPFLGTNRAPELSKGVDGSQVIMPVLQRY